MVPELIYLAYDELSKEINQNTLEKRRERRDVFTIYKLIINQKKKKHKKVKY